jgi:hypothetical protein
MTKVDEFIAAIEDEMTDRDFSESRKVVARQNGNLRRSVEKMCDDSQGVEKQAELYLAIHAAIDIITAIDDETIEQVATTLRKKAVPA